MAKANKELPGIIEVTWIDSLTMNHGDWMDLEELLDDLQNEGVMVHKTSGYLLGESDFAIAIGTSINAQSDTPLNRVAGGMIIPKVAIKHTKVLRKKE